MKKLLCLLIAICFLFTFGCASEAAYRSYTNAMIQANAYKKAPGIVQEFDENGKLTKQTIQLPDEGVKVSQIKDSEYAGAVGTFLNTLGLGGALGYTVHEMVSFAKSAKPNTNNYNVGGNMGGNTAGENMAGRDISTSSSAVTTATNTTTTTDN